MHDAVLTASIGLNPSYDGLTGKVGMHAGLPWGWHFNPHTHPIPTGIPIGIPMGIPIVTEPEVSTLLHVGLPSPIGRFLLFVK